MEGGLVHGKDDGLLRLAPVRSSHHDFAYGRCTRKSCQNLDEVLSREDSGAWTSCSEGSRVFRLSGVEDSKISQQFVASRQILEDKASKGAEDRSEDRGL